MTPTAAALSSEAYTTIACGWTRSRSSVPSKEWRTGLGAARSELDHASALLLAAGAEEVIVACVGKYGNRLHAVTPPEGWDPFGVDRLPTEDCALTLCRLARSA